MRSVLFVCTGNICRSPFAELLLHHLSPATTVASRGTHALVGHPMSEPMAQQLVLRGPSVGSFRSQQLEFGDLSADLILVMSERQRRLVLEESPAVARRTGLLGHVPELAAMLGDAALTRSAVADWTRAAKPRGRDVPDPYRQSAEVNAGSARMIDEHVTRLADLLHTGDPAAPAPGSSTPGEEARS